MEAHTIGAAVMSLAAEVTKAAHETGGRSPGKPSKSHETLDPEDIEIERKERGARKIRRLEETIKDYERFLGAVAKVEQPNKRGLQGFINPKWVHGLGIPNLFNKQHLFDNLALVFDPFECQFAALNRVLLYADDYDEIDLPYFNFPFDLITIFANDTLDGRELMGGATAGSNWTYIAKAKSKPYKHGEKSVREHVITFPLVALGGTVVLQRLLHKISKLHILKTKPSRLHYEEHEWERSTRTPKPDHGEGVSNQKNTAEVKEESGLHYVALRMMRDVLLKNEMTNPISQSLQDSDAIINQAQKRIVRARLDVPQRGENQEGPLTRLHYEAAQVLAELVACNKEVKDAAHRLHNVAKEHETMIIRDTLKQSERSLAIDSSLAIELQYAAQRGMAAVLEYLFVESNNRDIPTQPAINQRGSDGCTPLCLAAREGHIQVVRQLLTQKADPTLRDNHGRTALSLAAGNGHLETVEALLLPDSAEVNIADSSGRTPLFWAATGNSRRSGSIVEALLRARAKPNIFDCTGRSPLSWAAQTGNLEAVQELLRWGAEPDLADDVDERTPLWWAAGSGHDKIVCYLLDKGARSDHDDRFGRTPLSWAAASGHADVVEILLDHKVGDKERKEVRIDSTDDEYGRTPMSWAAEAGHSKIVEKLIDRGANPNSLSLPQGNSLLGRPPLSYAAARGHLDTVRMLFLHGAKVDPPYRQASSDMAEPADPPTPNTFTRTPLSWAARNGHAEVVKALLDAKSNPDIADEFGRTALWYAARNCHGPVVVLLLARDADPNIKDFQGSSALEQGYLKEHIGDVKEIRKKEERQFIPDLGPQSCIRRLKKTVASRKRRSRIVY